MKREKVCPSKSICSQLILPPVKDRKEHKTNYTWRQRSRTWAPWFCLSLFILPSISSVPFFLLPRTIQTKGEAGLCSEQWIERRSWKECLDIKETFQFKSEPDKRNVQKSRSTIFFQKTPGCLLMFNLCNKWLFDWLQFLKGQNSQTLTGQRQRYLKTSVCKNNWRHTFAVISSCLQSRERRRRRRRRRSWQTYRSYNCTIKVKSVVCLFFSMNHKTNNIFHFSGRQQQE